MADVFDNPVLCKKCGKRMKKITVVRNGFPMRALYCDDCGDKLLHPADESEYKHFLNLKGKEFRVKLRLVGNSYTVSIPKEIIDFMEEQEKIKNDIVKLMIDDLKKLNLTFD